jgi:tRNA(Ile)-lysidine synthase
MLEAIRTSRLWDPGERVLVAVSGGLDSTVLLELLHALARAHGGRLEVASVDHGLRPEAVQEVAAVGRHASALGLPFHALTVEVQPGPDLQARARLARRAALRSVGTPVIALAHHRDDQAETVLYRLLRGSGALGLRSMAARSGPWVRPLLREPRDVLEAWARVAGLRWADDPTNATSLRGRMRRLLPEIDALHGGAAAALCRSARLLARDDDLLDLLAREAWTAVFDGQGLALDAWRRLHPALRLRVLRRIAEPCPGQVCAAHLEAALDWDAPAGGALPLPRGWAIASDGERLVVRPAGGLGASRAPPSGAGGAAI